MATPSPQLTSGTTDLRDHQATGPAAQRTSTIQCTSYLTPYDISWEIQQREQQAYQTAADAIAFSEDGRFPQRSLRPKSRAILAA